MQNVNIVSTNDNKLFCFYHIRDEGIICKKYENEKWGNPYTIMNTRVELYTVNVGKDGNIYVFCQDNEGSIMLCLYSKNTWQTNLILRNQTHSLHHISFHSLISDNSIQLIYNIFNPSEKTQQIIKQQMDKKNGWDSPQPIDTFVPFINSNFMLQNIKCESALSLLFYQKKGMNTESNLGYREISPTRHGAFITFHTTQNQIIDQSFLTTNDTIHMVYIVKSMFSSQLIYRRKFESDLSNPIIIYEHQKIENCLLFVCHEKLYVFWQMAGQLLFVISEDNGKSFTKFKKYISKLPAKLQKVIFHQEYDSQESFFMSEVYADKDRPWDTYVIHDFFKGFYPKKVHVQEQQIVASNRVESQPPSIDENYYHEQIAILKNQIHVYKAQVTEKDAKIMQLAGQLQTKSKETSEIENTLKKKYNEIILEKEMLKKEFEDFKRLMNPPSNKHIPTEPIRAEERVISFEEMTMEASPIQETFLEDIPLNEALDIPQIPIEEEVEEAEQ